MNMPSANGASKKDNLRKFRDMKAKAGASEAELDVLFAELVEPTVCASGQYLLTMFFELNSSRQSSGMGGVLPISYMELKAYSDLTDVALEPFDVDAIRLMDRAYLDEYHKVTSKD